MWAAAPSSAWGAVPCEATNISTAARAPRDMATGRNALGCFSTVDGLLSLVGTASETMVKCFAPESKRGNRAGQAGQGGRSADRLAGVLLSSHRSSGRAASDTCLARYGTDWLVRCQHREPRSRCDSDPGSVGLPLGMSRALHRVGSMSLLARPGPCRPKRKDKGTQVPEHGNGQCCVQAEFSGGPKHHLTHP